MNISITSGISGAGRRRLGQLLRAIPGPIRTREAARVLEIDPQGASWLLSAWVKRGWLQRLARGVYVPVPLETRAGSQPAVDPWVVAAAVFAPCYMAGWTAAGQWDLTEQLYRVTAVVSARRLRDRKPSAGGAEFMVITRALPPEGRVTIWRDSIQLEIADAPLTIVDMLDDPRLGPGIREASRTLGTYLRSDQRDDEALVRYAEVRGNGAVFKRLGLLLERIAPKEVGLLAAAASRLTAGYAKLDPNVAASGRRRKRWRVIENVRVAPNDRT